MAGCATLFDLRGAPDTQRVFLCWVRSAHAVIGHVHFNSRGEVNMAYYSVRRPNPTQKNPLSIGSPTQIEKRRATRHHFVSAVEVINVESWKQLISRSEERR